MLALRLNTSLLNNSCFLRSFTGGIQLFGTVTQEPTYKRITLEQKLGLPEKPKRPLSPFIRFVRDSYQNGLAEKGDATAATRKIAEEWKKVDVATKKKMLDDFHKEMDGYPNMLKKYFDSLSDSDRVKLEAAKIEQREAKNRRKQLMEEKKTGKPTRPPNAYLLFVAEQFGKGDSKKVGKETAKELTKQWQSLSPEQKKIYEGKFHELKQEYEKKIVEWEAEMIRQGKESLIRQKSRPAAQPTPRTIKARNKSFEAPFVSPL